MSRFSFLKSDRSNINSLLFTGIILVTIGILDVSLNTFFKLNLFSFLPGITSFLFPFIIAMFGFHLMRIEFSGSKTIDALNKNINTFYNNLHMQILNSASAGWRYNIQFDQDFLAKGGMKVNYEPKNISVEGPQSFKIEKQNVNLYACRK